MIRNNGAPTLSAVPILIVWFVTVPGLVLCTQSAAAREPDTGDRHIQAYFQTLDRQSRLDLRDSLRQGLRRNSSRDGSGILPDHRVYHAVFLEILTRPSLAAAFSPADLRRIEALPAHGDGGVLEIARQAMEVACQVIETTAVDNPGAAPSAVKAFNLARNQVDARLNADYREALARLSESARSLVEEETARLAGTDSLVLTELDLDYLSFAEPAFVIAFLRDACANRDRLKAIADAPGRTLDTELADDFGKGSVQVFQSQ